MNRAGVARVLGVAVLALLNLGCSRSSDVAIDGDFQRSLQARLIDAKPG